MEQSPLQHLISALPHQVGQRVNTQKYFYNRLNKTLSKTEGSGYLAYLDDILIYSKTEKEHLEMLDNAFKCLSTAGLKIKLSKCPFFKKKSITWIT